VPFKCSGVSVKPKQLNRDDCQGLVDKISYKIRSWPVQKLTSFFCWKS